MAYLKLRNLLLIFALASTVLARSSYIGVGCYVDKPRRAISGGKVNFPYRTVISKCYEKARREGNRILELIAEQGLHNNPYTLTICCNVEYKRRNYCYFIFQHKELHLNTVIETP